MTMTPKRVSHYPTQIVWKFDTNPAPVGFDAVCAEPRAGHGVLICLKKPGHLIVVVVFDDYKEPVDAGQTTK